MSDIANVRTWLEYAQRQFGEQIEAIVVGQVFGDSDRPQPPDVGILLPLDDAWEKLDREFKSDFCEPGCAPIYAWTRSRVFFITEHDGTTLLSWVPRNPVAIIPRFNGAVMAHEENLRIIALLFGDNPGGVGEVK